MPPTAAALIKGYLPVRLRLPQTVCSQYDDETYFYVREHQSKQKEEGSDSKPKSTIFVTNAPVVPGVSTKILLKSLFGRFADVARVTVVQNPRGEDAEKPPSTMWTEKFREPSFLPPTFCEGKYAHVVFETPKGMKKAMRALHDTMKSSKDGSRPGLSLEKIEIQTLSDESNRVYRMERKALLGMANDEEDSEDDLIESDDPVLATAALYRVCVAENSLDRLLQECNEVMQAYEDEEESKRKAREAAKQQPDDDGFVTVSYSNAIGSQVDLEETKYATGNAPSRRKGNMRSRKKKEAAGAKELSDFYRFQRRENKKRSLDELRAQFEEDLQRVKKMKEERQYRPF